MSSTEEPRPPSSEQPTEEAKEPVSTSQWVSSFGAGLGGWMSNVGGYATSITEKLKTVVQEKVPLVTEFQEEQKKFEREQQRVKDTAVPPWVGYNEEEKMKAQILELSADSRTVLRQPPPGVQFQFNFSKSFPVAQAILKEDKRLQKLRFDLVPKKISEEKFWHNYFYRVFLVKQSSQLASLASSEQASTVQDEPDHSTGVELSSSNTPTTTVEHVEPTGPVDEFASDALTSDNVPIDRETVATELEQLGVGPGDGDEWEAELARELEDLGVVAEEGVDKTDEDQHWEDEIERMLEMHSDSN